MKLDLEKWGLFSKEEECVVCLLVEYLIIMMDHHIEFPYGDGCFGRSL